MRACKVCGEFTEWPDALCSKKCREEFHNTTDAEFQEDMFEDERRPGGIEDDYPLEEETEWQ